MLDLVSRGDVLDALIEKGQKSKRYKWGESWELNLTEIKEAVESVPYAEPERKKGKFLGTEYDGFSDGEPVFYEWECSECGCIFEEDEPTYNFCPNCGAEME